MLTCAPLHTCAGVPMRWSGSVIVKRGCLLPSRSSQRLPTFHLCQKGHMHPLSPSPQASTGQCLFTLARRMEGAPPCFGLLPGDRDAQSILYISGQLVFLRISCPLLCLFFYRLLVCLY